MEQVKRKRGRPRKHATPEHARAVRAARARAKRGSKCCRDARAAKVVTYGRQWIDYLDYDHQRGRVVNWYRCVDHAHIRKAVVRKCEQHKWWDKEWRKEGLYHLKPDKISPGLISEDDDQPDTKRELMREPSTHTVNLEDMRFIEDRPGRDNFGVFHGVDYDIEPLTNAELRHAPEPVTEDFLELWPDSIPQPWDRADYDEMFHEMIANMLQESWTREPTPREAKLCIHSRGDGEVGVTRRTGCLNL